LTLIKQSNDFLPDGACSAPATGYHSRMDCADTTTAVLHQIRHALAHLIHTGEPDCIDLAALPFGSGDQQQLLAALGEGEVRASVDALGETRIRETRYSGVWLVDYRNSEDERIGLHIEVALVPRLLQAQPESLPLALDMLTTALAANPLPHLSVSGSKHHG
jgi:hydrogenase-1 operon protein HyaF